MKGEEERGGHSRRVGERGGENRRDEGRRGEREDPTNDATVASLCRPTRN